MLTLAEPFSPEELEGHFNSTEGRFPIVPWVKHHQDPASFNFEGIITILRMLVVPPSEFGRTVAMKTASEYLRNPIFRNGADLHDLKDLLSAWAWLYPDEPDLQIVVANIDLKTGDFFNAFCRLKGLCEMEEISPRIRTILQRGLQQWVGDAHKNYNQMGMTLHMFEMPWELPVHFMRDGIDRKNISNFVALTAMKARDSSDSNSSLVKPSERPGIIPRADRVSDFVAESWGKLGEAILSTITTLLDSSINSLSHTSKTLKQVNGWPFSECTFVASRSALAMSAICPGSMWHSLTECVLWITDAVGQPENRGVYKRPLH